jgi:hypothetical protein
VCIDDDDDDEDEDEDEDDDDEEDDGDDDALETACGYSFGAVASPGLAAAVFGPVGTCRGFGVAQTSFGGVGRA